MILKSLKLLLLIILPFKIPVVTLHIYRFRIQKFLLLHTDCTYVFYVGLRKENSDYVPKLNGFYDLRECFYCAVRTE